MVYPKDLFAEDDSNLTKAHKREYFRKICSRYELDKDIKLMYIGNYPQNDKLNLRIPYEYEKLKILNELHKRTGHTGYHRLYDAVKDNKYFWDSLTNDCKEFVYNYPSCIKVRYTKLLKPKIISKKNKRSKNKLCYR